MTRRLDIDRGYAAEGSSLAFDEEAGMTHEPGFAAETSEIQVMVGCDDGYARHLCVMLLSLFEHCTALPVRVHVMVPAGFSSRARLEQALGENAGKLTYHVLSDGPLLSLKQRYDLTAATYYRLLISDVLPPEVQRVIYLDCDMLLRGDLAGLWQMSIGSSVVGAVRDPHPPSREVLGLPDGAPYFNAGMLLIDLARWRSEAVGEAAFAFASAHPDRLTYNDQCALNWVLRGRWAELDPIWNLQTGSLARIEMGEAIYLRPLPPVAAAAQIVHFNAPGRPWLYMDEHPFKPIYQAYKERTPWSDERPIDYYTHNIIVKTLRSRAPILLPIYNKIRTYI
jgi:lipopolysaccharide biosynthesis glycosyltransferase